MNRMTRQNLNNIKDRFEKETGASLGNPATKPHAGKYLVLSALICVCALLAGFTIPLFTPLDGDELCLEGTYLGDGIVSVRVENKSDKVLTFTDAKLYSWNDGEVTMLPGGEVLLADTKVEPNSEGYMTVDLSRAYDIPFLETTTPGKPRQSWYYLLLTNQSFLFGHDWMCSFSFGEETAVMETEPEQVPGQDGQIPEGVADELRFYFEKPYFDVLPAFNEAHFSYQQKAEELLMRTPGTLVRPVDPVLVIEEKEPKGTEQSMEVTQRYSSLDGYKRMVGSRFSGVTSDFVLQVSGILPESVESAGKENSIPLVFFAVYETEAVAMEDAYAFLYGRILPFEELAPAIVYEGEGYKVYDVTDLYYTDLERYLRELTTDAGEETFAQLEAIRDRYRNPENLSFCFPEWEGTD